MLQTAGDEAASLQVELAGQSLRWIGFDQAGTRAAVAALVANGAHLSLDEGAPDVLLVSCPLRPDEAALEPSAFLSEAAAVGAAMKAKQDGRIIFLLSALAVVPMRRFPRYSAGMAAAAFAMRGLAMSLGPSVRVNGVGAGALDAGRQTVAGDRCMLTHVSSGRAGALADLTNAVLFLADPLNSYTTGQLLLVDGGWSAGYGRNF